MESYLDKRIQDFEYLKYLINHKLAVMSAGNGLDVPLTTTIKHDWSKFKPEIWEAHRDYFYGDGGITGTRDRNVYLAYKDSRDKHFISEPEHHALVKSPEAELEAVADWYGVFYAQEKMRGHTPMSFKSWWFISKNRVRHQLSEETVLKVDNALQGQ